MADLWTMEEGLWLEGVEAFERVMAETCLMVFAPMGIMRNAQIVESLRQAPRWTTIAMTDRADASGGPDITVLAYRARAQRADAPPYTALCSSTYRRTADDWRLLSHQQTPLEGGAS